MRLVYFPVYILIFSLSCMRYLTHSQEDALVRNIDLDETLKVAAFEMSLKNGSFGTSLPLWVIKDQKFDVSQVAVVKDLYLENVEKLEKKFDIWHLTWAISNIYRLGDDSIKSVFNDIIDDVRVKSLEGGKISVKMSNPEEKLFMGDAHGGGRAYAKKHIVAPGNPKYLQSFQDYLTSKGMKDNISKE